MFDEIKKSTILDIIGAENGSQDVFVITDKGTLYLYHDQQCCEHSSIEELEGNPKSLIGGIISNFKVKTKKNEDKEQEWTFYDLQTTKGDLFIRWLGDRSIGTGMYSVECNCRWLNKTKPIKKGSILVNVDDENDFIFIAQLNVLYEHIYATSMNDYSEFLLSFFPDENGHFLSKDKSKRFVITE
jgi:hypothetical protein